jgi:C-terminal peptidase prc
MVKLFRFSVLTTACFALAICAGCSRSGVKENASQADKQTPGTSTKAPDTKANTTTQTQAPEAFDGRKLYGKAVDALLSTHPYLNGDPAVRAKWEQEWKARHEKDGQLDSEAGADKAVQEMLASEGITHSVYSGPPAAKDKPGTPAAGIGVVVRIKNAAEQIKGKPDGTLPRIDSFKYPLEAVEILEGSPAAAAGIEVGDFLTFVNEKTIDGLTSAEAVNVIKGDEGSQVKLHVWRDSIHKVKSFDLKRARVVPKSVSWKVDSGVAYVRLKDLDRSSIAEYTTAVKEAAKANALILDLRGNPGGPLLSVQSVLQTLLPSGLTMASSDKTGKFGQAWFSTGDSLIFPASKPLVVIVDHDTACGAEVIAGALKGRRAKIVGTKTFGRGVIRSGVNLPYDRELQIYSGDLYVQGEKLDESGVKPDLPMERGDDPRFDQQLELARMALTLAK